MTSTFVPKGLSAPGLGLFTCIKALKYIFLYIDYILSSADLFVKFKHFNTDTRTESSHLPITLKIWSFINTPQDGDDEVKIDRVVFSRNQVVIDRFVKNLSELNETNYFQNLLYELMVTE